MSLGPWSGIVGPGTGVFFYNVNGTTYGYVNGNTSTQFTAVEDTTPYHFGARYKASTNELTLFINGGAEVTADAGATSNLAGSFIGNTTAQDSGYGFVGNISNIAGYGVDIGDGEFAADYAAAISSGPPPPPAPATRSQILDANMTWAADDFVATAGTGAIAGYSIYVGYNGTWVLAPTGELMQTYSILSTVELTGYSAAALAAALIAAIDDGQPHTGPF
jgi:hypothetical protein